MEEVQLKAAATKAINNLHLAIVIKVVMVALHGTSLGRLPDHQTRIGLLITTTVVAANAAVATVRFANLDP